MDEDTLLARVATVQTVKQLADCLSELRGSLQPQPSLRELQEWGMGYRRPLPTSTVHDVLKGVYPPRPDLLRSLLAAFQVHDESRVQVWLEALDRVESGRGASRQRSQFEEFGAVSASRFFVERQNMNEVAKRITTAQEEVWLWGTTMQIAIPYLRPYFWKALSREVTIRVLLIKRMGAAMTMAALRSAEFGIEDLQSALQNNLDILRRLRAKQSGLQLRLIDYLAPYTLYAFDPGLSEGLMELRLGSFHGDYDLRPTFTVQRARDGDWFDYFYEQFTLAWGEAEPDTEGGEAANQLPHRTPTFYEPAIPALQQWLPLSSGAVMKTKTEGDSCPVLDNLFLG